MHPDIIEPHIWIISLIGVNKHGCDLAVFETSKATADACYLELDTRNQFREHQELVHIALDGAQRERVPDGAVLGWDRIALACEAHAITPAGTTIDECEPSRTGTVDATLVTSETRTP